MVARWASPRLQWHDEREHGRLVINAEGGELHRLTRDPAFESRAAWSGDGRWIYFRSNKSGTEQIWKMPAGGGEAVQITRNGAWEPSNHPMENCSTMRTTCRPEHGIWSVPVDGDRVNASPKKPCRTTGGLPIGAFTTSISPRRETDRSAHAHQLRKREDVRGGGSREGPTQRRSRLYDLARWPLGRLGAVRPLRIQPYDDRELPIASFTARTDSPPPAK